MIFGRKKSLARESSEKSWDVLKKKSKLEYYLECIDHASGKGEFKIKVDHIISEYDRSHLRKMKFWVETSTNDSEISWPTLP